MVLLLISFFPVYIVTGNAFVAFVIAIKLFFKRHVILEFSLRGTHKTSCTGSVQLQLSRKNPEKDKILKSIENATRYLLFLMKLDRKSNRDMNFQICSLPSLPPPKDLLFKTPQYLKSTLEIVWHHNSEVIIPILISLLPSLKKYIASKKMNSLQKRITENQDIRRQFTERILIELLTG